MVRDGSSGKGGKLSHEPDAANPDDQFAQDLPSPLTQELAGLLPTGSELASLASLVSAAGQRSLAPVFKDGLSALAYGSPHGKPAHVLGPPEPPPEPLPDDEPMPIPSPWRNPGAH